MINETIGKILSLVLKVWHPVNLRSFLLLAPDLSIAERRCGFLRDHEKNKISGIC